MPAHLLQTFDREQMHIAEFFAGEAPFTICSFAPEVYPQRIADLFNQGQLLTLEESGAFLGLLVAGNDAALSHLNQYGLTHGAGQEAFSARPAGQDDVARVLCSEGDVLVSEKDGGILAYLTDEHAGRLAALLNVESMREEFTGTCED
jgi:hypothetical protein